MRHRHTKRFVYFLFSMLSSTHHHPIIHHHTPRTSSQKFPPILSLKYRYVGVHVHTHVPGRVQYDNTWYFLCVRFLKISDTFD